tara:strand:- start:67 stop:324 length:258 start_codon:yes stop_codon:yes gene_type:complete
MEGCNKKLDDTMKCGHIQLEEYGCRTTYCSGCYEKRRRADLRDKAEEENEQYEYVLRPVLIKSAIACICLSICILYLAPWIVTTI